jgi:hypothetical protein
MRNELLLCERIILFREKERETSWVRSLFEASSIPERLSTLSSFCGAG